MASGYTPKFPEREEPSKEAERSQQPDDPDDKDVLTCKSPPGITDGSVGTFIFKNQGHTLGNVLRDQLLKYPQVHFCGYSIPHPVDNEMHLRIQIKPDSGITVGEMLRKALEDVVQMCDHLEGLVNKELDKQEYATT